MTEIHDIITSKILAALDEGTVPWRKPWSDAGLPRNAVSNRPYTGINSMLLNLIPYSDPRWLTFRQVGKLGGHVRKGERSTLITFVKNLQVVDRDDAEKIKTVHLLRYYLVFNAEQTDGLALPPLTANTATVEPIKAASAIVDGMPNPPKIAHNGGSQAAYSPATDRISLPPLDSFETAEGYAATLFHELSHSTGHPTRLDRETLNGLAPFGSPVYSKEELIAEFGSAFLCGHAGISPATLDNQAAYIDSWKRVLKADTKLVVQAASAGQKAADCILGVGV